ncbi:MULTISPECIES: heavy metal-binding domain-containing protein [Aquirufa]|uniref:Heavy metal binding domain-containing protein n=4 Tax=Aquirufa TaxID=2676247 RepID=A0ABT4JC44_9BACT|nr:MULTISPECIES: heavy metal-binding domain-containing protein [Aquirufa]MBZ1327562.1 hypothetical protein [Aquirufa aurantiipilula]MCZ2472465.1 hypothetical protein [Aquirufa ecclesiirivi]MCZ2473854.1 hypothetical protein [Aquirufa ecclesiirivi]MDF0694769.1 heavy metal-binding domain-containing protein [Aquirufa ecclesiirivi]MDF5691695.1 heavy metal-binding domain-containing protein [Aquirufa aurantiipilula]
MKNVIMMAGLMLGTYGLMAQEKQEHKHDTSKAGADKKEVYQCPMKCEGNKTYAKKGKCPACTMELKAVKKAA